MESATFSGPGEDSKTLWSFFDISFLIIYRFFLAFYLNETFDNFHIHTHGLDGSITE